MEAGDDAPSTKKPKRTSVVMQLLSVGGSSLGPPLDIPLDSTRKDLEKLVHTLSDDKNPYAFYAKGREEYFGDDETLRTYVKDFSTEETLEVRFEPLAVFRVRRVARCAETMPGHTDAVLHVRYGPDGTALASGGGDAMVRFWDPSSGTPRKSCPGHRHHVLCLEWAPDGSKLASGDRGGELRLWDPISGKCTQSLKRHTKWISAIAWCPLHCDEGDASVTLATASKDGNVKIWTSTTGKVRASLSGHTDGVEALAWAGDHRLFSASRDRSIKIWRDYLLIATLQGHSHRINALALSSAHVLRVGPFDALAGTTTKCGLKAAAQRNYDAYVLAAGGPAVAERLVSGSDDATLLFWITTTTTSSKKPSFKRLTGHQQAVNAIQFSPDSRKFASASFDKKIKLWHGYTGTFLATFTGHVAACYGVAWSPDSRILVSASKDSTLKVWHAADDVDPPEAKAKATGTRKFAAALDSLAGHLDEVFCVDYAPNSGHLASGSKDRTIKLWAP